MQIMQLLQVIGMTLEQTTRKFSVLYGMISRLGELPCNGVSYIHPYTFQLTTIFVVLCERLYAINNIYKLISFKINLGSSATWQRVLRSGDVQV